MTFRSLNLLLNISFCRSYFSLSFQYAPMNIPPIYAAARNGTNGNEDFLLKRCLIIITAENTAAIENAPKSRYSRSQNPINAPIIKIRILSPYPKASPDILLISRKKSPAHPPAHRSTAEISRPQKHPAATSKNPDRRNCAGFR